MKAKQQSSSEKIAGWHSVSAVLKQRPDCVHRIWLQSGRNDDRVEGIVEQARLNGVTVKTVSRAELDREAGDLSHQGVLAWVEESTPGNQNDLDMHLDGLDIPPLLLLLDGVEDPRNLGACLRTADAAGVNGVITPRDRSAGLTAAARKTAAGAAETVPIFQVSNLARCMRSLQERGIWLVGLAGEGDASLYDADLQGPMALVLGAEGQGLRRLSRENCDQLVKIPMFGSVESLNVSVAAAVCIYEAVRQRSS